MPIGKMKPDNRIDTFPLGTVRKPSTPPLMKEMTLSWMICLKKMLQLNPNLKVTEKRPVNKPGKLTVR